MRPLEDLAAEEGGVVCENRGTGITAMLEALRTAGMEPPRFDVRHTTFRLTFSNTSLLDAVTLAWLNRFAAYNLSDAQRIALAYARREGRLTHSDYRRLNPGLDSAEVTRNLADLVRRNLLQQHGVRRWTHYTLPVDSGQHHEADLTPEEVLGLCSGAWLDQSWRVRVPARCQGNACNLPAAKSARPGHVETGRREAVGTLRPG